MFDGIKLPEGIQGQVADKIMAQMHKEVELRVYKELQKDEKFMIHILVNYDIKIGMKQSPETVEISDKKKGCTKCIMSVPVNVELRRRKFFERLMVRARLFFERMELAFAKGVEKEK